MNRAKMAYAFLGFLLLWYVLVTMAAKFFGVSAMEGIGLGTAGGVFLGAFKDMWQFLWRTASPQEKAAAHQPKPPTNPTISPGNGG